MASTTALLLSLQPLVSGDSASRDDEDSLASEALAGDVSAWNALVRRHDRRVLTALLARGVRIDRAREICQEHPTRVSSTAALAEFLGGRPRAGRASRAPVFGIAPRENLCEMHQTLRARGVPFSVLGLDDELVLLSNRAELEGSADSARRVLAGQVILE